MLLKQKVAGKAVHETSFAGHFLTLKGSLQASLSQVVVRNFVVFLRRGAEDTA